jgi:hypothetical protein
MALAIDHDGGRFVTVTEGKLKRDRGSDDQNMVMSLMCKKIINKDGRDYEVK